MNSETSQFLTLFAADSFDNVPIRTQPPKNVEITDFNQPHTYKHLLRGAVYGDAFKVANESLNIMVDLHGVAVGAMVGELATVDAFDCPPSSIIRVGKRFFVLWLLSNKCGTRKWSKLQNVVADKLNGRPVEYIPLPSYNLVKFSAKTESYSYEPIQLHSIRPHNRYDADALLSAAIITEPTTEIQGCKATKVDAAKAFLTSEFGKAARLQSQNLIKAARMQNISERTLRTAKAALNIKSVKTNDGWLWSSEGLPLAV